eukprot:UN11566
MFCSKYFSFFSFCGRRLNSSLAFSSDMFSVKKRPRQKGKKN